MTGSGPDGSLWVFDDAAELFGLLSTPCRLRIVRALCDGESNVNGLLRQIAVSQPNMSQHLGLLYRKGLVAKRRVGAQVVYRIRDELAHVVCALVRSQLAGCRLGAAGKPLGLVAAAARPGPRWREGHGMKGMA